MIHWMLILTLLSQNPGGAPGDNFLGTHKKIFAAGAFFVYYTAKKAQTALNLFLIQCCPPAAKILDLSAFSIILSTNSINFAPGIKYLGKGKES